MDERIPGLSGIIPHCDRTYSGMLPCFLGGFRQRVQQLRAVNDDAAVLLIRPGEKPRHILEDEQRDVEGVAESDEARSLAR